MKALFLFFFLILGAFLAWPYTAVYRLEQALIYDDQQALQQMIDVEAVREQIKRKLNKNVESNIGDVSNGFIDWLQSGIQRLGSNAVDEMVDLNWVVRQLRAHNPRFDKGGVYDKLTYAFFDGPDRLLLRIGELDDSPVHAHLSLQGTNWRITAVYN
ncbi:MAG: DUF2939 domain-containing protein [Candidatus Thiodiazotropha taylori]|nr:DUF2939 domain-containing protein [Candidatus Thiodiazotropha taylori]MCG7964764.1 DUF2939 domain-containing protein [Candidatus Thiodiazotropha endolucinida]RLW51655.1 MAG: hypothetical protein B6D76_18695 [gamma proteobacterium symbiont of Stewartia floridana]MCG7906442.1 DUF2939 domain-containing protein [Candidatus Thiodiazotropha taylori]MCG7911171.1 DUF2939 domain-containing protein [Candidatus Thiodiazotropha taylori]